MPANTKGVLQRDSQTNIHPDNPTDNYSGWEYGSNYGDYAQDKINPNAQWGQVRDNQRYNNTQQTYDYLNNVKDVQNKLRDDMARESAKFNTGTGAANQNYTDAIDTANKNYNTAIANNAYGVGGTANNPTGGFAKQINDYLSAVNQYIGDQGYRNALRQAQQGATQQAYNAASTAAGAARSAGMNKAQAAALGMGNAINAYNNGLAQQQAQVQNNYNNALNTYGNQLNQQSNIYGQLNNSQNNIYGQTANAAGNRYGQTMANLNNAYATNANTINSAANNLTNALAQDIAQRQNQQNVNYSNQDVIEKLFTGLDSGIFGNQLAGGTQMLQTVTGANGLTTGLGSAY